jgi:hypothetical protein
MMKNERKGSHTRPLLRALASKCIRIMFRCWKSHTPYDEATYLFALKKAGNKINAG